MTTAAFSLSSDQDLHLLDNNLTTARLLAIITAESREPQHLSDYMVLEVQD